MRGSFVLSLLAVVLLLVASSVMPLPAHAATAHADADDPAHRDPDCDACHKPHTAPTRRSLLANVDESEVCYVCHGDAGGSDWNVETWIANSFASGMASGHELEDSTDPDVTMDMTNSCTGCHGVHGDPDLRANLPANEQVAGSTIDSADPKSWCLACHNANHAWYAGTETSGVLTINAGLKSAYEALIQDPERLVANGYYPTLGTFPGSTGNTAYMASTHASIPAATVQSLVSATDTAGRVAGDCLWCHASHRSTATYDGLLGEYRATTATDAAGGATAGRYAQACFECHGNSSSTVYLPAATYTNAYWKNTAGAPDIYTLVTDTTNSRSGHRVKTASGAYYAQGSPLPCYECHNPHGSKNGNVLMISDALGGNLNPGGTAAQVRQFCFSCHTTGDGTPAGWDSDSNNDGVHTDGVYTTTLANTAAGSTAVGISRTVAPPTSYLRLTTSSYHLQAATQSCMACHDDAHNPGSGVSNGGKDCYICHSTYMDYMEDGTDRDTGDTDAGVGSFRAAQYHHVMGSATKDGDEAVGGTDSGNFTDYPAAGTDVYCLSCHVDHDKFNSSKSSSLRRSIGATAEAPASVTAASSDFNPTTGGVCLGCHYLSRTKDTANRKSDGTSAAPVIPDTTADTLAAAITAYDNSPHQYGVTGRARNDDTSFAGDCSKCHSDRLAGTYYKPATTGPEFGLHYDPSRRILEALGRGSVADPYAEERFCYSCHSTTGAGFKTTADRDWYGIGLMDDGQAVENSQNIYAQMGPAAAWRTTTASQLYFKPSGERSVTGNYPTGDQSTDAYSGASTWQARAMSPGQASAAFAYESYNTANETVTGGAGGTTQNWRRVRFVSPPVAATTSVSAAAWTVSIYARESSANANAYLRPYVYVWRADNTTKVNIVTPANLTTEFDTTALPGAVRTSATAAGSAVTLQPGDKIVVDVAIQTLSVTIGGSYQFAYSWGDTAQGYLQAPVSIQWSVPSGAGHVVDSYSGLHKPAQADESRTYIRDNKHVECADCHSPHAAGNTLHTVGGASGNTIGTNSPLQGVWGVEPTTWPTWASPTGAYGTVAVKEPAAKEYQICFKCHSGYNSAYTAGAVGANGTWSNGWGSSGANLWTDVALEFNTVNASYHPVVGTTGRSGTRITGTTGTMQVGWRTVGQTMTCSDCHQSTTASTTAYGPHGSAVKKILRGYWPTNSADGTGAYYTLGGSYANLLCANCHQMANIADYTTGHNTSRHGGYRCVDCHIVVPHGGKLLGLIGDGDGNMPSRYARDNVEANTLFQAYDGSDCDCADAHNRGTSW